MLTEHTDKIRSTREDSTLLEKYFNMVGQRPAKVDLILGERSGHVLAGGVILLFPGVDLDRTTSEGIYVDFISMFDPEDMGVLIFCQDEREYVSVVDISRYAGRIYNLHSLEDWQYYGPENIRVGWSLSTQGVAATIILSSRETISCLWSTRIMWYSLRRMQIC